MLRKNHKEAIVRKSQDRLLYSYGEELIEQGKFIGTVYDSVIIPQEALGSTIIMECIATEKGSMNQISNLLLMEAVESSKYPVIHQLSELVFFLAIFVISFLVLIILLFVEHPMVEAHYIQWIAIETTKGSQRAKLEYTDKPRAEFKLAGGEELVAAYEYCNLHGLWKK